MIQRTSHYSNDGARAWHSPEPLEPPVQDASPAPTRTTPVSGLLGSGLHVAAIMDGNGRWASRLGMSRSEGHRAGVLSVRRAVRAARELGVSVLSLYVFSADNWKRPRAEVRGLLRLLRSYLRSEASRLLEASIRLTVIGSREGLPEGLLGAIAAAEERTAAGAKMRLRVAINYSGRDAIRVASAGGWTDAPPTREEFRRSLGRAMNDPAPPDNVDIMIRTGGERRLSDFLLWESAYAELFFTPTPWPDFDEAEFREILRSFRGRQRTFGRLPDRDHDALVRQGGQRWTG